MATEIALLPLSLGSLDELPAPELLCFVANDERPLTALSGFVDWRLCGGLTRQLRAGLLAGAEGDSLLMVPGRALPSRRVFVTGIGKRTDLTAETALAHMRRAFQMVMRAGGGEVATTPPGWGSLPPNLLLGAAVDAAVIAHLEKLWLLVPEVHAAEPLVREAAERRGAHLASDRRNLPGSTPVLRSSR